MKAIEEKRKAELEEIAAGHIIKRNYDRAVKTYANMSADGIDKYDSEYVDAVRKGVKDTSSALDDYNAYLEQKKFYSMSADDLDAIITDYDEKIASHKKYVKWDKGWLPFGISPDEADYHKGKMNELENESAKYRERRDYVKAQEVSDTLPADVKTLLDEYNSLEWDEKGFDMARLASAFMGAGGESGGGNSVKYSSDHMRKQAVATELIEMGYDNYLELAEYRQYITDAEFTEEYTKRWEDFTKEHPVLGSTLARATSIPAAVSGLFGSIEQLGNTADLIGGNPYSPYYNLTRMGETIDGTISESFEDGIISAEAKSFLYGTGTSFLDSMIASMATGSLGLGKVTAGEVLLGLGAANHTLVTATERGLTKDAAMITATFALMSEILPEHFSLGKVLPEATKNVLIKLLRESFVNMTEEMATEVLNITTDYMINGGASEYYSKVEAYKKQGMSDEAAKKAAAEDAAWQVFEAGASGFLIGVPTGSMSYGSNVYNRYQSGKDTVKSGQLGTLVDGASDVQGDDKYKSLYESVVKSQQAAEKDADYDYSMREYYKAGKLSEKLAKATESERNSIVRSAVSDRFKSLGETADIDVLSSAVTKTVFGEKLTHKEKAALKDSKYAQRVINEAGDVYGEYSSAWTDKAKADVDALYERRYAPSKKYSDENYVNRVKETVIEKGQDETEFNKQFDLFQNYGRQGADFEEVKNTVPESSGFTETQMKAAYDLGAELKEKEKLAVVTGIDSMDGTDIYVTTTTGKKQKLSEINVEAATGNLIRSASKYDIPTANAFIRGYNRSATVSSYARAFDAFYAAGSASADTTFSDAMKKYGELVKYMDSSDVARKAFDLGRAERKKADASVVQKKQTGKHPAKGTYQSKTVSVGEEAIDEFFTAISKKTGIDIDRVHNILNNKKQVANAQYGPTKHKITVSASAQNELQASVHELTHAAFAYNAEKMKQVKKAVIDYFLSQNSESEFEEILRQYGASYEGDSRADIEEEFVADAIGGMFTTEEGVQNFLEWLQDESGYNAKEKKTILQRITEWLSDIIEAIRDIMNSGELNGAGKLFAKENCDELTKIRKMFLEALDGAGVNYREGGAVEGNKRNSFAGIKAKISNIQTFEAAQRLEDVGKATPEEIRQQTGWFRGYDGMWRFELDDSKMVIRDTDIRSGETKLSEMLDYPQLFEAYPQLKDVTISAFPSIFRFGVKGSYNSERNEISLSDEFLVDAKVHRELEAIKKSDEYKAYKERLESAAREHGEKRLKLSREFKKIREAKLYTDMVDLLYQLDDEGKVEEYKKATEEWQNSALGKRYGEISAELKRMDEVNPQSEIEKAFRESELGKRYHELTLDVFSGGEVINDKDTRNTLIHEIQHAIQHIEGFASGASPKYWKDINADPFSYTPSEIKKLEAVRKKASDYLNILDDEDIREDAQRYWHLNDHYFDDNLDTEAVDKEIAEIEARAEAFGYQDKLDRYFELENKVTLTFNEIERRRKRSPDELYRNTAGEIEARDATARLSLTAEERKNTRPDIDRKDVVFSDGGVSYDFVGHTADGIEVYETSEEIKELPYSERKKIFSNLMASEFYGRTAKFLRNGHAYYAKFDVSSIDKNIAGDKNSSSKGWKAKINVGADGNIFELVENSKYDHSNPEFGKKDAPHKKVGYWDYFLKTVQIDNMVYDVLINIRRKTNQDYVYSIRLWENKKIKVSPPVGPSKMSSVNLGAQHSADNISQSEQNVNDSSKNSLPLSNLNDLHQSNIEKVTELSRVAAQMTAHINYIGSSQTKRVLSALNIQAVARELKKEYQSKADIHKLSAALTELYEKYEAGRVPYDVATAHIDNIVDMIINESVYMKPDISDYAKEILREVRSGKIKLSEAQKAEAANHFGSYNEFRRAMMGSAVFSEEGTPLDVRWQELSDMYPGRFDRDTVDADQPIMLYEAIGELRNTYNDESGLDLDSVKAQLSAEICAKYISIPTVAQYSNEYAVKERELLESLKAEKQEYKRIYAESYRKAQSEYGGQLKKLRAEQAEEILRAKARMEQRVQNIADTRLREKKRNRLIKTVKRLDRLLRNPGKGAPSAGTNKYGQEYVHLTNIPEGLKKTVIDFCSIFIDNDAGVFTGKYTDSDNVIRKKINELRKQYQNLKQSEAYMSTVVSEEMTEKLEVLHDIVGEKRLAQLTAAELDTLNEIADHLITVINNEVEMWVNGKKTKVTAVGSAALNELSRKDMKGYILAMKGIDKLSVMNLKPVYFFEKVGGTLETLWKDILGGQDKYVRNMQFAQQRFSEVSKKYHLQDWIDDDAKTFKTAQGHEINLTRGQALLIWATWKREGKAGKDSKHLFEGGIVYPDAVKKASEKGKKGLPEILQKVYKDGTAHRIRVEDMLKIDKWLTDEQKKYADELVHFLSTDIGAWGNEISMQLYGVNKFNEKYYIPFNSAGNYLYKGMGEDGTKLLKSEGFTKETQWDAKNPLVVDDFTQVAIKHIERMSMYNSMVIPLDNFSRVWNYQERADAEGKESMKAIKALFQTAYGDEAQKYVEDFLRDVNGGVMSDSRELGDKWLSKFKKSAVMASASVMIQQPSAIGRAFAEINPKYFVSGIGKNMLPKVYEECKKYAPVAVLKEIGGFDTVSGQSMADWMLKRDYEGKDKLKAFFKDSQFRDEIISYGPAWADRVTWAHIWLACKNEVRVKQNLTGEALLEAAGKRFTEVINKTQVYDSVLSRSAAMRSNTVYMKMITAFMAEPTTSLNMLMSGVDKLKTPDTRKKGAGMIASVATAQLLNSILVSFIYAARDDDEEKGYWEVWSGDFVDNFLNGLNPLTMIPIVKDIFSLISGYSVDRSDMTVISNFVDSINAWRSDNKSIGEKISGTVGSVADLFGIPLKNLIRDVKAVINVHNKVKSGSDSTFVGALTEMRDSALGVVDPIGFIDNSNDRHLYNAWVKGNKDFYEEYASRYKSGSSIKSALESQIEERYVKGKLDYDEAFELYRKLGYSENEATYKLRELEEPVEDEEAEDKYADFYSFDGAGGIQDKADAEREEERQQAAEKDEEYSEDSDYKWLDEALESGNLKDIETETKYLIDKGVSESDVNSHVSGWLKKNDTDVIAAGNEYAIGDFSTFESTVKLIAERYGVSEALAAKAVRSVAGESGKEIEGTIYVNADLHKAIEFGNDTVSKKIASAIIEAKSQQYIAEGKNSYEAQKSARSVVRQSINSKWKEAYQKADPATRVQIRQHMYATGAYDYLGQLDDTLKKWRTELEEEQRKK